MSSPSDLRHSAPGRVEYLRLFATAPPKVRAELVTIDGPTEDDGYYEDGALFRRHVALLARAAQEGRLWGQMRQHRDTGRTGYVMCESWNMSDTRGAAVLAELVSDHTAPWVVQTEYMDRLATLAGTGRIAIVSHGPGEQLVPFLVTAFEQREGKLAFEYLARLLVTEYELAQWWMP